MLFNIFDFRPAYPIAIAAVLLGICVKAVETGFTDAGEAPSASDSGMPTDAERSTYLVSFELDVLPVLTASGCNMGACHGKQRGQNGFQLSLLAFDPDFDFAALTRDARGRRLFPAAPQQSLLLQKSVASLPHGGGKRFEVGPSLTERC